MERLLKKWFTDNLLLKLIALLLAILTWLAFYSSEDPTIQASFKVPVSVEHLDEFRSQGHYIAIEGEENLDNLQVEVYIRARTSVIEQLRSRDVNSFMQAYVDVYELEDTNVNRLMVHYEVTDKTVENKFEFYDIKNTTYLEVDAEDNVTKEIEVRCEITGKPEDGYMFVPGDEGIQISPDIITLTGPSSQLDEIAYGKVTIRIEDASANVNKKGDIVLYNEKDEVVKYSRDIIRASISEASVFVPVYMVKTVALQTYLTGSVPEGYEYGKDVTTSVSRIEIYGPESTLNKINSIALPSIDLSEIMSNYKTTYQISEVLKDLYPKEDVRLVEGSDEEVVVSFTVGKQENQSVELDTSKIQIYGTKSTWNAAFTSPTVTLDLVGLKDNLKEFDINSLIVSVRLKEEDFVAGKHKVELEISGLGDVSLKDDKVSVEIEMTPKS